MFSVPARMDCSGEASEAVSVVRQSVLGSSSSRSGEGCGRGGFVMPLPSKAVAARDKRRLRYSNLAYMSIKTVPEEKRAIGVGPPPRRCSVCAACGATRGNNQFTERITEHGRVKLCKASSKREACTLEVSP